jgi:putative nucleotidyltransferase with HDIG domain
MSSWKNYPSTAVVYFVAVVTAGLIVIGVSGAQLWQHPPSPHWLILAALTLLTGTFTVKVPAISARISVSEAFVFTSVLMYGPAVGTLIVALDCAVMSLWLEPSIRTRVRTLFNLSSVSLAIWIASNLFLLVVGVPPEEIHKLNLGQLSWPLFAFAGSYFLLNSGLVAVALAIERRQSVITLWTQNFPWLSLNYFGGASVSALLVAYTRSVDLAALGIIIPLLVTSYLTYRTSLGRVEDAKRHVEQVNALYMSTIEALAMAVDAKDQITHGHIRRVQMYATELAKRLGVSDHQQLQAIEAAALLHDMGKLAIPEHILNKPGKLTPGEFEKMKQHANIGADLLSSIPFPYPVVPIVRHHHENWDGTGYPNKVAGTDIPLGARILSVVDCFDALTSDRPYRPRLSNEQAFEILRERRGSMYDPLVVDAFIRAHEEIAPAAIRAGQQARSLIAIGVNGSHAGGGHVLQKIHEGSAESRMLLEAARVCQRAPSIPEALEGVASLIRELTPAHVLALYAFVPQSDLLRCVHATNDPGELLTGFEIAKGERTTGWVAANDQSILNSAAALDLGAMAETFAPPLKSALCTAVKSGDAVSGVLAFYSRLESPFTERHTYVAEQLAALLPRFVAAPDRPQRPVVRFPEITPRSVTHRNRS